MENYLDKINKLSSQKRMEYLITTLITSCMCIITSCSSVIILTMVFTQTDIAMKIPIVVIGYVLFIIGAVCVLYVQKKLDKHYFGGKK